MRLTSATCGLSDRSAPLRQEPEVPGKKQMILKFAGGSQGMPEEPPEIPVSGPATPFGNVGGHRCRGPHQLGLEGPADSSRQIRRFCVHLEGQL